MLDSSNSKGSHSITVYDSSLIIEADKRGLVNKLALHIARDPRNRIIVPRKVWEETVGIPARTNYYSRSAKRIDDTLFQTNLIMIESVSYTDSGRSKILDNIADCIARRSGKKKRSDRES